MVYLVEICDNIQHDTPVIGAWTGGDLWKKQYGRFSGKKEALEELKKIVSARLKSGYSLHGFEIYNHSQKTRIEYFLQKEAYSLTREKIDDLEKIVQDLNQSQNLRIS